MYHIEYPLASVGRQDLLSTDAVIRVSLSQCRAIQRRHFSAASCRTCGGRAASTSRGGANKRLQVAPAPSVNSILSRESHHLLRSQGLRTLFAGDSYQIATAQGRSGYAAYSVVVSCGCHCRVSCTACTDVLNSRHTRPLWASVSLGTFLLWTSSPLPNASRASLLQSKRKTCVQVLRPLQ